MTKQSKTYEVWLSPENVNKVETNHRASHLKFKTNLKGPAGADIHVVLPHEAIYEAVASAASLEARARMFPPQAVNGDTK